MPDLFFAALAVGNITFAGLNATYYPNAASVGVAVLCAVVGLSNGALAWVLRK